MSDYVVLRLLDSFFRHKMLHVLPIIAFTALGIWYLATQDAEYQARGVLLVEDETLLTSLSGVGGDGGGFQSPASRVSTEVNSLLQTEAFVSDVAAEAGLGSDLRPDQLAAIQASVGSYAVGENLVHVWSNDLDPEAARAKAAAAINSLIQFNIDSAVGDSTAAEDVLDPLTNQYRRDLEKARQDLGDFIAATTSEGSRSADEQIQFDQLSSAVAEAQARYDDAIGKEESARLAKEQAEQAIQDRFQVVDDPRTPTEPLVERRTQALTLAVFMVVGGILAAASVVLAAALDQTIRHPLDVTVRLDTKVLGVIPDTSGWTPPDPSAVGLSSVPDHNDFGGAGGRIAT